MRLDLEKIKELEIAYQNNPTPLNTLINLINAVITKDLNRSSLQYKTLLELGVIKEDDDPKNTNTRQLNS